MITCRKSAFRDFRNWRYVACLLFVALAWPDAIAQVQPSWVARYDGPARGEDRPCAIAPDRSGNVFVFGPSTDTSAGAFTNGVSALIKYDASGNQLWVARDSGASPKFALPHLPYGKRFLATDADGNAYVTGVFWPPTNQSPDIVTAKYNPAGRKLWSALYNASADLPNPPQPGYSYDAPSAVTVDAAQNVYVTGFSGGYAGTEDFVTIKYDAAGNQLWVRRYNAPANSQDIPVALALDSIGNLHVTGWSVSVSNHLDYLTIKYAPDGTELWTARYDGAFHAEDEPAAVVVDDRGNVFVSGGSLSSADCAGNSDSACRDVTTLKYDAQGRQLWVARHERLGQYEPVVDLALDYEGNLLVCLMYGAGLLKYDANGNELWSSEFRLPDYDNGTAEAMAIDGVGNTYVAGSIYGSPLVIGVAKFASNGSRVWAAVYPHGVALGQSTVTLALDADDRVYVTGAGESQIPSAFPDITTLLYQPTNITGLPVIVVPPAGATVPSGGSVTLSVVAAGQEPLHYRWRFRGLDGLRSPELDAPSITLSSLQLADMGDWSVEVSNAVGTAASPSARLIVNGPPVIAMQPQDATASEGGFHSFFVNVLGTRPLAFQWFRGNERVGQNRNYLQLSGVQTTDAGSYYVVVTNQFGSAASTPARLTVQSSRPTIAAQPRDQTVQVGETATFSVTANGQSPLRFQWQYNGGNLAGATSPTLTIASAQYFSAGNYRVVVANGFGSVTSNPARLTVVSGAVPSWVQTNATPIRIPDSGPADPSPSSILVSGLSAAFERVTVTLHGLVHSFASDLNILLVGPTGRSVVLMSGAGGSSAVSVDALTFDDEATDRLSSVGPIVAGSYRPTSDPAAFYFGPAAPLGPHGDTLALFQGMNPNGRWDLYVFDDAEEDSGSILGGWSLQFHSSGPGFGDGTPVDADPFALDQWQERTSPPTIAVSRVVHETNGFLAVGLSSSGRTNQLLASSDGIDWVPRVLVTSANLASVAFGGGSYVAVGERGDGLNRGTILTSPDGVNWSNRTAQLGQFQTALAGVAASDDGRFVAVGTAGTITTSLDRGATWQPAESKTSASLHAVTYGQGMFVTVGALGVIRTSKDGINWEPAAFTNITWLLDVAYGGGRFVAVGFSRSVITSTDGTNWISSVPLDPTLTLRAVTYGNGAFVCGGGNGYFLSSWDGTNWAAHALGRNAEVLDLASDGTTVVGAFSFRLFQSDPLRFLPPRITRPPQPTAVRVGLTTNLSVNAIGTSPLTYQWLREGTLLPQETNRVLTFTNASLSAAGSYSAVVQSPRGSVPSAPASLRVGFPPSIRTQPLDQQVVPGEAAVFSVDTEGTAPFDFHWRQPGTRYTLFAGQGSESFWHLTNIIGTEAGIYGVVVSNDFGSVRSRSAQLSVLADADGDGLPDVWEVQHRLNPNDNRDAALDLDGDGFSNLGEYRAGTNPTNDSSVLKIYALPGTATWTLFFFAETNKTYTIEQSQDLEPDHWEKVHDFVAANYMRMETIQVPVDDANRYFRIVSPRRPEPTACAACP